MARDVDKGTAVRPHQETAETDNYIPELGIGIQPSAAQVTTTFLAYYEFNSGPNCVTEGFAKVDVTAQLGDYFHVDDFALLAGYNPLEGNKSLWCGARPDAGSPVLCGYTDLPGYGNGWNQAFCTKACLTLGPNTTVEAFLAWDSEPNWDATQLEIDDGCVGIWDPIAGGFGVWDGTGGTGAKVQFAVPANSGTAQFRFHFQSDGGWSDQDGLWPTNGAFFVDLLEVVTDAPGVGLAEEDFEDEAVGANDANDWESCTPPGYGDFSKLYHMLGDLVVQEDKCNENVTCVWGFYNGSTVNYSCGGWPTQLAVPEENIRGQYIENVVESPFIAIGGTGTVWEYAYDVYFDLKVSSLVFYIWHVRSVVAGCPGPWKDEGFVTYGAGKTWGRTIQSVGSFLEPGLSHIQLAAGLVDMCLFWKGLYGDCLCHSHAPLIDNLEVYRVAANGPQWAASRDLDQFQDNFAEDGTTTGFARADAAQDIKPNLSPGILPGDSSNVTVADPDVGLDVEANGRAAVFCYISIDGPSAGTAAVDLIGPDIVTPGRRMVATGNVLAAGGRNWHEIQMDSSFTPAGGWSPDRFNCDLNDQLFVPGDTVWHFYGARSVGGTQTYACMTDGWSGDEDADNVAEFADEFTILPAEGPANGGDILYVDGMHGRGAQPYHDTAFELLGIMDQVDRFDIRGPSSAVANHPASRVKNHVNQLIGPYNKILWNCGNLVMPFGDGSGSPDKSNDCKLLFDFLNEHTSSTSGVYLNGDDVSEIWASYATGDALALRGGYMDFNLVNSDAESIPGMGTTPKSIGAPPGIPPGGVFWSILGPDTLVAFGGCNGINDFDVIIPAAPPCLVEMDYHGNPTFAAASVLGQTSVNPNLNTAKFILSGFSYHYIRDDRPTGMPDRVIHLLRILRWFDNQLDDPIGGETPSLAVNELDQNYPNPFNPTTTIKYQIKDAGHVSLKIYNVAGQLVRTLVDEQVKAGEIQDIQWRGLNDAGQPVSSGVYFYKLISTNFTQTKKMVLLK
jgi:hypothetical protein